MSLAAQHRRVGVYRGARVPVPAPVPQPVRCAIYTRKSTSEGLDSGFTTLDVQRQAAEAYIASQGWIALPERYDDGGFSGGTLDRPALKRLLTDIEHGRVDCVVVHKIDRLSRSLLDFVRIAEVLEVRNVGLVSVTQQISTTSSAGRLMLNVLFSFAQFERELIGERTSAAMSAVRKLGRWCGGPPILGYDIDREKHRLVINPEEAEMVRELFELYLQRRSLLAVVQEVNRRGWTMKSWVMKNGTRKEGGRFDKAKLQRILINVTYTGKIIHKGEIIPGEHPAIIDQATFDRVQALLKTNGNGSDGQTRNKHGALLKSLLRCGLCGGAMAHHYTKKGTRLYRYYVCTTVQKQGRGACSTPSLPAQEIEDFIVEQIRRLARDPELAEQVFTEAVRQQQAKKPQLEAEAKRLQRDRQQKVEQIKRLVSAIGTAQEPLASITEGLAGLEAQISCIDQRLSAIREDLTALDSQAVNKEDLTAALGQFTPIWDVLHPSERVRIVQLLVERVEYDARQDAIQIAFRQSGIRNLVQESTAV